LRVRKRAESWKSGCLRPRKISLERFDLRTPPGCSLLVDGQRARGINLLACKRKAVAKLRMEMSETFGAHRSRRASAKLLRRRIPAAAVPRGDERQ
jgi:hypothetical protein